jgi:Restriction endonuclease
VQNIADHGRELSWEAIKDVVTGEAGYKAKYPGVAFQKICVTTALFKHGAHVQAKHNDVRLVDRSALKEMHSKKPIALEEIKKLLHAGWVEG